MQRLDPGFIWGGAQHDQPCPGEPFRCSVHLYRVYHAVEGNTVSLGIATTHMEKIAKWKQIQRISELERGLENISP